MKKTRAELLEELALGVQCPKCHAYGWCKTDSGKRAETLHYKRSEPLRGAFALGYTAGVKDGARSAER